MLLKFVFKFQRTLSIFLTGILLTCVTAPWTAVNTSADTVSPFMTVTLLSRGLEETEDGIFQSPDGKSIEVLYFSVGPESVVSSVHFSISTPDRDLMAGQMTHGLETAWKISYPVFMAGLNTVTVTAIGHNGSTFTKSFQVRALENQGSSDLDWEDADSDLLLNWQEDALGTDKTNPDTDGDGLPDGYEMIITRTNPLMKDTDQNGINDGDEDFDGDGLSNKQELEAQTDPHAMDSGISFQMGGNSR